MNKLFIVLGLTYLLAPNRLPAADPEGFRLLACLCVREAHVGQPDREYAWNSQIAQGPGKRLVLIVESGGDARAVLIPWNQDQTGLANGWLPFWAKLSADEPRPLSQARNPWLWDTNAGPFTIQAVVFHNSDKTAEEMCQLVDVLQKTETPERVARAQLKKLQALVDQCAGVQGRPESIPPTVPANVAGVFRNPFDWCKYAVSNSISRGKPTLVNFRSRAPVTGGPAKPLPQR